MSRPATPTQLRALQAAVQYQGRLGYYPTMRELAKMLGLRSISSAHQLLSALKRKGYVDLVGSRALTIKIPPPPSTEDFVARLMARREVNP